MNGFLLARRASTIGRSSAFGARRYGLYPGRFIGASQSGTIFLTWMSFGTSMMIGPGRPVVAMWNASFITRGRSSVRVTR